MKHKVIIVFALLLGSISAFAGTPTFPCSSIGDLYGTFYLDNEVGFWQPTLELTQANGQVSGTFSIPGLISTPFTGTCTNGSNGSISSLTLNGQDSKGDNVSFTASGFGVVNLGGHYSVISNSVKGTVTVGKTNTQSNITSGSYLQN